MNRKSRWSLVGFMLLATLMVISACSGNNGATSGANEAASANTAAEGDTGEGAAETAGKGIPEPRVAFVYIGPPGDGGWTFQHDEGRKYMEEKLGIKSDTVENVPESADAERIITELAQNHDIIFTTSFGYMDYTENVAKKFPDVKFMHTAGYKTADNMTNYFGRNYEASYLSGIAAGKMTKVNKLGYVGAFPIPEVIYNINAFALGAQSVNPDVTVDVIWSNTWYDPATEKQAATSLLDKGADIIAAYQDSPASLQAAAERGGYGIGNDSDMSRYAPENYITNPIWNWGPYYTEVVQSVIDGTWTNEPYLGDLKDGMVDIAPLGKSVPADVKQMVEDAKAQIIAGELNVFAGPITDADGKEVAAEGGALDDAAIYSTDWFVKGVSGTIPK